MVANLNLSAPVGKLIQEQRREHGLTQEQLARKAEVPYTTLIKVESGTIKNPSMAFVWKVCRALQISLDTLLVPRVFQGENSVHQIWQDILETLVDPGEYMCISGIDETQFIASGRGKLMKFIKELERRGLKQKLLCSEGNKEFLEGAHLEYRAIPKEHFNPTPMYVYGNKVAILIWGPPQQSVILENSFLADAYRKQFLFIWEHSKPVGQSLTAKVRKTGRLAKK